MKKDGHLAEIRWTDKDGKSGTHGDVMPADQADRLVYNLNQNSDNKTYWTHVIRTRDKGYG